MLQTTLYSLKKTSKERKKLVKSLNEELSRPEPRSTHNPAVISEYMKDITYIRQLADSNNLAELNEALMDLGLPMIDSRNPAVIDEQRRLLYSYLMPRTVSGNPVTIKILGNLTPEITGLKVTMNPIQSGSGTPSPTNIRHISGRTEASVTRTGANQWDEEWEQGAYNSSGEKVTWSGAIRSKNTISVFPNSQYYIKFSGTTTLYICWYAGNSFIERVSISSCGVVTPPTNATKMTICTHNDYGTTYNNNISVNYPSTDTEYHAYTAETHTHQYSETIYGGVDDFMNGGLTNEWGYIASYDGETIPGVWISDRDVYAPGTTPATGAEVCYKLATPTTIETTPEEITLLKGENVISTDGDSIEITYKQNFT